MNITEQLHSPDGVNVCGAKRGKFIGATGDAERYVRIKGAINDLAEFVLETTQSHPLPVSYSI
jgi:hypothetical protein